MEQDWINALIGGVVIGLAASIILLANGRIAGISGMLGQLTKGTKPQAESLLFILGLVGAPAIYGMFGKLPTIELSSNIYILIFGGVAVGIGTLMGNGCTSGHGICGNARLSKRSIVATATFILTGILTVAVMG